MTRTIIETVTLHCVENGSDKIYQPAIEQVGDRFDVVAQYGRRGAVLTSTTKKSSVEEATARKAFASLVAQKIAKGYVPITDASPTARAIASAFDGQSAGIPIQLLNAIDADEYERLVDDSAGVYAALEKKDGVRRLLVIEAGEARGVNRKGLYVPLSEVIATAAVATFGNDAVIDGELIGEQYFAFDALRLGGRDRTGDGFLERYNALFEVGRRRPSDCITVVPMVAGAKRGFCDGLRDAGAEGIVFRELRAPHSGGRPKRGGSALKYKFYNDAQCVCDGHNDRHSVALAVFDDRGMRVPVGNLTIPPNTPLPPVGAVLALKYLYAFDGGSLFQPSFIGVRDDIGADECTIDQLVYKPAP
jgi:bifunctional non-homologous end joining protein LigD